jgi:hypothetical protein
MSLLKNTALGLAIFVGVTHTGAFIGHVLKQPVQPVQVNYPPVTDYSSYTVTVNPDGTYTVNYRGHDPTVLNSETYTDTSNGVFGIGGRNNVTTTRQYVPGTQSGEGVDSDEGKLSAEDVKCIKAEGGGQSNGALVGASVASSFVPMVTSIPYIGWLASGWLVMFGQDMGSQVGGEISNRINGC